MVVIPGTKELGDDDRTADVAAEGKGDENQGDVVAVAYGSQGIDADEFACHQRIGNIVKLLEDDASEHRETEAAENRLGISDGKVLIHKTDPSFCMM